MFFRTREKKEAERRGPTETCQLSENVECQLYVRQREDGTRRIDFALARVNPRPGERSFKTFRIQDAVELPKGLSVLYSALSKVPDQPAELREQLAYLSGLLEQVSSVGHLVPLKAVNGHDDDAGEPRIFA